jgi:hypothetical protein
VQVLEQLQEMRIQFADMLAASGLLALPRAAGTKHHQNDRFLDDPSQPWNRFSHRPEVIKAVLCAALAPNVASVVDGGSAPTDTLRW